MTKWSRTSDLIAFSWPLNAACSAVAKALLVLVAHPGTLPVQARLPFDSGPKPAYFLTCAFIIFTQFNLGLWAAGSDVLFPSSALLIYQQFRILKSNLKHGFDDALLAAGVTKRRILAFRKAYNDPARDSACEALFPDVFATIRTETFQAINLAILKRNIAHHQMLLEHCKECNQFFSYLFSVKVSCICLYVFLILLSLLLIEGTSGILEASSYAVAAVLQLVIYSASGQLLQEGANIRDVLYNCPWYLSNYEYRKVFIFFQLKALKQITTKAGGYFEMSAPSFLQFLKTLFSIATVFQNMLQKK